MPNEDDGSGYGLADYDDCDHLTWDMMSRALFDCQSLRIGDMTYRYNHQTREVEALFKDEETPTTMTWDEFKTEELASYSDAVLEKARVV